MKCEVLTSKHGVHFELLPSDKGTPCTRDAVKLLDWSNGRTTAICAIHDAEALGLPLVKA
jgi:hypothetical protein